MYLKNPANHQLRYYLLDPQTKQEIFLTAGTMTDLVGIVIQQMREFDRVTGGAYTRMSIAEAANLKLQYTNYINKLIQHQMCLRMTEDVKKRSCYNDGLGDSLHSFAHKIDDAVEKLPKIVRAAAELATKAATKAFTGKSVKRLGGCSSCGGTKSFDPAAKRNLGRVGITQSKE